MFPEPNNDPDTGALIPPDGKDAPAPEQKDSISEDKRSDVTGEVVYAGNDKTPAGASEQTAAAVEEIPPLSQREREHLTYLRVLGEYNIASSRRQSYKRYGAWFIIISGIIFLTLIFSLEAKILFLCLWIITILCCVAVMIRADYVYDKYKEYLGFADELDLIESEEEEEE